jgi:acyl carrier protein
MPRPTHDEIVAKVIALAAEEAGVQPAAVALESRFFEDLNYDSLGMVELTMNLEEAFELAISDEDADGVKTVGQVVELIETHCGRVAAS